MRKFTDYANLASNLAQNAQLSEIESLLSKQAERIAEADAKATKQADLRDLLFRIQQVVTETVEKYKANPFQLAWALLRFKKQTFDTFPFFDPSQYSAWEDKERAGSLGKLVERTIADCREKLGDADYQKLVSAVNFEVGEKVALTEYDETLKKYELSEKQAASESELARKAEEKVKLWEGQLGLPYRAGKSLLKLSIYGGLLLFFLVAVPSCMMGGRAHWVGPNADASRTISATDLLVGGSLLAAVACIPLFFLSLIFVGIAAHAGEKRYGPCPPKPKWPSDAVSSVTKKRAADLTESEKKDFPGYAKWLAGHEELQAELTSLKAAHGTLSRAEIAARIATGGELFASLAQKYEAGVSG